MYHNHILINSLFIKVAKTGRKMLFYYNIDSKLCKAVKCVSWR